MITNSRASGNISGRLLTSFADISTDADAGACVGLYIVRTLTRANADGGAIG